MRTWVDVYRWASMEVCIYECKYGRMKACCVYVCASACLYVCISVCLSVRRSACRYERIYVCMSLRCIYVRMYLCMHACNNLMHRN